MVAALLAQNDYLNHTFLLSTYKLVKLTLRRGSLREIPTTGKLIEEKLPYIDGDLFTGL